MPLFQHTLADGRTISIQFKRSARKNLILRPLDRHSISINIPPFLSDAAFKKWLADNEALLLKTLAKTPQERSDTRPSHIWFHGIALNVAEHSGNTILQTPSEILLPPQDWPQQKEQLRRFLIDQASDYLLPRLARHAATLQLHPAATALSNAKTFWGVCRRNSGIRLNWRLIGAPEFVADYVCIHELCHLPHPDHSPRFWALVNRHTPHTEAAKRWLKQHGNALFALDK
ncbi:M48 family metallopeptidase [Neisseria sp. ZJ106]|uniref:SprT family zinc-dependent metalloprotease n=1 Tax=Neisseria lisongii TaxID=2912188 RepID=A0ABY7RIF6_9NEIS|nr:SprT family zinc-dependent metalloprotease [Neisseria lisongii]MCF7521522.1 M48 family metallopeptidase [Neisseria lisongii]WCL71048.1 SprT family zinc-dependent metalloprotease [Neisseria lisongii]